MILTSDSTVVRIANSSTGSDTFISIQGHSIGEHGDIYGDGEVAEEPAEDPLQEVDWYFDRFSFPNAGSEYSIWLGEEGGSFHERFIAIYVTVGNSKPVKFKGRDVLAGSLKLIGSFKFSGIEACCKKIVALTGCLPPKSSKLSEVILSKQDLAPVIKPDQANARRPGETSQQYWKRTVNEQLGKFPHKYEGD